MAHGYQIFGFAVIAVLYVSIGVMAAIGTIFTFRKILSPKSEQILYAMALILVALFYLAFAAYFDATSAWRVEGIAVLAFVAISLLGVRLPFFLIAGYCLHGIWDFLHELQLHGIYSAFQPGDLTAIPLAYGFFCAAYDFSMAVYFYRRRFEWIAAWKAKP
jgi:hypothetical protein